MEVRSSDVRRAAMDLLARREHSSQEMITKLKRRFRKRLEGDDLYHAVVDELVADGLLSDERYAASMARQLVNRGCGPKKLSFELRQKGCDPDSAINAAFPNGIDWFALSEEVYERRFEGSRSHLIGTVNKKSERSGEGSWLLEGSYHLTSCTCSRLRRTRWRSRTCNDSLLRFNKNLAAHAAFK